jgi:hypothetical protein
MPSRQLGSSDKEMEHHPSYMIIFISSEDVGEVWALTGIRTNDHTLSRWSARLIVTALGSQLGLSSHRQQFTTRPLLTIVYFDDELRRQYAIAAPRPD